MASFVKYYTYAHYNINGDLFYIGKGTGSRAFRHNDRSKEWKDYVYNTDGITIKIIQRWETEEEAYKHERELISHYTSLGIKLVNATLGGKGPLGLKQSEETKIKKRLKMLGFKYKQVTCPHCNTTGGETSMKQWHFDKCTGAKKFKARVSIDNKRIFLGNFATKEQVKEACIQAYMQANKPLPKEFIRHQGL